MAEPGDKVSENKPGKFYVDCNCIDCNLCRDLAPSNFTRADGPGYSYVYKQPENSVEIVESEDAMFNCPVDAIGNDG